MILVAGGQLDPNIGALLRRMLQRRTLFRDLLVGPDLIPRLTIDLQKNTLSLNGELFTPSACFIRHDVFLTEGSIYQTPIVALNWFYAIRGWTLSQSNIRSFNSHSTIGDNNKIQNLKLARQAGLPVPDTIVTNELNQVGACDETSLIQKPVTGGEYTTTLHDLIEATPSKNATFPRFVQKKLRRPELRIYRVGCEQFAFSLVSDNLDYRQDQHVQIRAIEVPQSIGERLTCLCELIGLDFAAADFMEDPLSGELQFLEINSQPMFVAFDRVLGGRLCDAIIDHLSENRQVDRGIQEVSNEK